MKIIIIKMKFNIQERVFLVSKYFELKHIALVIRAWNSKYRNKKAPDHSTIRNIVSNFEKTGSVAHVAPKRKNTSEKRQAAKMELEKLVADFPSLSIRKAASAVGVSPTLVYRV
jgi:hypothetical protein